MVIPPTAATFKFATRVVLAILKGAVPVVCVDVICPVALKVVKAPELAVPPPMAPGAANVAPLKLEAFKFATLVVLVTANGAVPIAKVDVIWPVTLRVVNAAAAGAVPPIAGGDAK